MNELSLHDLCSRMFSYFLLFLLLISPAKGNEVGLTCGIQAAYVASHLVGKAVDYDSLQKVFPEVLDKRGISITQIEAALQAMGVPFLTVKMNIEAFIRCDNAIGIFWRPSGDDSVGTGHYVVVANLGDGKIEIIDPPADPMEFRYCGQGADPFLPVILFSKKGDFSEYADVLNEKK